MRHIETVNDTMRLEVFLIEIPSDCKSKNVGRALVS